MAAVFRVLIVCDSQQDAQEICEALRNEGFDPRSARIDLDDTATPGRGGDIVSRGCGAVDVNMKGEQPQTSQASHFLRAVVLNCDGVATRGLSKRGGDSSGTSDPLSDIRRVWTLLQEHPAECADLRVSALDSSAASAGSADRSATPHAGPQRDSIESGRVDGALFHQLAERIRDVFLAWDAQQRRIIYVSPSYEKVWHRPRTRLYENASEFFRHIHPDDRQRVSRLFDNYGEHSPRSLEYRILLPNGSVLWMSARNFPILDANGKIWCIASLVEDVTALHLAEQGRFIAEKQQRDTLVREVHHRIKNNLQGVVGLLRQHATAQPELKGPLEGAISQVNAMAVVHGLQSKMSRNAVLLCEMVEAICRSAVGLTGVPILPVVDRVLAHPVPVSQEEAVPVALILNELVFNAVKHRGRSATAGPLSVVVDRTDTSASVRILNPGAQLPDGFDFAAGRGLSTGLALVRSLLPTSAAQLSIRGVPEGVVALLELEPPIVNVLEPQGRPASLSDAPGQSPAGH